MQIFIAADFLMPSAVSVSSLSLSKLAPCITRVHLASLKFVSPTFVMTMTQKLIPFRSYAWLTLVKSCNMPQRLRDIIIQWDAVVADATRFTCNIQSTCNSCKCDWRKEGRCAPCASLCPLLLPQSAHAVPRLALLVLFKLSFDKLLIKLPTVALPIAALPINIAFISQLCQL